jgi:hypothetical protein
MFIREKWEGELLSVPTGWNGLEDYIKPIMTKLNINPELALEFGIDSGYSLKVFSQLFNNTVGVDMFVGDAHIGHSQGDEFYEDVLKRFTNNKVEIIKADFRDFIKQDNRKYDLIHIDIVHYYDETFQCADWSIQHSDVVILHDTCSFPEINRVCLDISKKHKVNYYNIGECHGLGVLYR